MGMLDCRQPRHPQRDGGNVLGANHTPQSSTLCTQVNQLCFLKEPPDEGADAHLEVAQGAHLIPPAARPHVTVQRRIRARRQPRKSCAQNWRARLARPCPDLTTPPTARLYLLDGAP